MNFVHLFLIALALLCFVGGALDIMPPRRGNLVAAGLFFWMLATLIK